MGIKDWFVLNLMGNDDVVKEVVINVVEMKVSVSKINWNGFNQSGKQDDGFHF